MDHFLTPSGTEPIEIPYIDTGEEYDGGNFEGYAKRKGWLRRLSQGHPVFTGKHGDTAAVAFFQNWLFFGTLIKVFEVARITVRTADFLRTSSNGKSKVLSTRHLPQMLQKWYDKDHVTDEQDKRECKESDTSSAVAQRRIIEGFHKDRAIHEILALVGDVTRLCCSGECRSQSMRDVFTLSGYPPPAWSLPPELSLAILALRWTLHEATRQIYGCRVETERHTWWESTTLRNRSLNAGWCPKEIAWFMYDLEVDAHYYLSSIRSPRWELDHTRCTKKICRGMQVAGVEYRTKHTENCTGCNYFGVSDQDTFLDIIRNGKTPVVSWDGTFGELSVVEYDPLAKMEYVAISHVWSDGMGNEKENSLPRCQLSRIQKLVNELNVIPPGSEQSTPGSTSSCDGPAQAVRFWMDTLCVPVRKEDYPHRKSTIARMRTIYSEACRVLVLDTWIQELPSTSQLSECAARLYLSNWERRLWTCQEGVMAQSLHFQFKDRSRTIKDLEKELQNSSHDGISVCRFVKQTLEQIPTPSLNCDTSFVTRVNFQAVLKAIRHRTTTRQSDETICIITLMGKDPSPLLSIKDPVDESDSSLTMLEKEKLAETRTCEKRMMKLLGMIKFVPQQLIFHDLPRLHIDGFRWAPTSFLGQEPICSELPQKEFLRYAPISYFENISSLRLQDPNTNDEDPNYYWGQLLNRHGLLVSYPGMIFGPVAACLGASVIVVRKRPKDKLKWYTLSLKPNENGEYPPWNTNAQYAMITSTKISVEAVPEAILGTTHGHVKFEGKRWLNFKFLCRARLDLLEKEQVRDVEGKWGSRFDDIRNPRDKEKEHVDRPITGTRVDDLRHGWCVM